MKLSHNIDIRSITAVKEYYSDQYLVDLKNELERFDKSEIIATNRNINERVFSDRYIDWAISSSLATTLFGYNNELDLNYPEIFKYNFPSVFRSQLDDFKDNRLCLYPTMNYYNNYQSSNQINTDSLYQTKIDFLTHNNLKLFLGSENSDFIVPSQLIEKEIRDIKSGEILYILK